MGIEKRRVLTVCAAVGIEKMLVLTVCAAVGIEKRLVLTVCAAVGIEKRLVLTVCAAVGIEKRLVLTVCAAVGIEKRLVLTVCAAVGMEKRLVLTVCGAVGRAIEEASEEDYYNESATCDGTQIVDLWDANSLAETKNGTGYEDALFKELVLEVIETMTHQLCCFFITCLSLSTNLSKCQRGISTSSTSSILL